MNTKEKENDCWVKYLHVRKRVAIEVVGVEVQL